ncbi:helix-turn-helix transcriptional regulator [Acetobacter sp. AN02]|uniref:helix-turn-helix transcriptional regulator n=1 Tax=Acetobacter sp. AN02 TaxID=2894186 RepID=UPI0038D19BBC
MSPVSLLSIREVASRVGLSSGYVRKLVIAQKFPAPSHRFGPRAVRWLDSDLEAWLKKNASKRGGHKDDERNKE